MANRYCKYEIKRLSYRKDIRERSIEASCRLSKLDVNNRFQVLLVYYCRLYTTHTLAGFLFDLDQSSICREGYAEDWTADKAMRTNPSKNIQVDKKAAHTRRGWKAFPWLYCLHILHRAAYSKAWGQEKKDVLIFGKKRKEYRKDTDYDGRQSWSHHSQNKP